MKAPVAPPETRRAVMARNTVYNLTGTLLPLVLAFATTPFVLRGLGTERFGVLTVAWALAGYVSIFDLGLGRALTAMTAERLGTGREREVPHLAWTALAVMLALGTVAGVALALAAPWLARATFKVSGDLRGEVLNVLYLLAISFPLITSMAGLRGLLEARQKFGALNVLRLAMGVVTFAGPLATLAFSSSVVPVVAVLVGGRLVAWGIHLVLCLRAYPGLARRSPIAPRVIPPLLRYGGWVTVGIGASGAMHYVDRFVIGAVLSMTAVTYYATPFDAATRMMFVSGGLVAVLFPEFASRAAAGADRVGSMYAASLRAMHLLMFPVALVVVVLAPELLRLWIGTEMAENGATVLRWIMAGVFLNGLAMVPACGLQATGRPDLPAKANLFELPFYPLALWFLLQRFGIEGAAIAWTLRVGADAVVLSVFAIRHAPVSRGAFVRSGWFALGGLALFCGGALIESTGSRIVLVVTTLTAFGTLAWRSALTDAERKKVKGFLPIRARWLLAARS